MRGRSQKKNLGLKKSWSVRFYRVVEVPKLTFVIVVVILTKCHHVWTIHFLTLRFSLSLFFAYSSLLFLLASGLAKGEITSPGLVLEPPHLVLETERCRRGPGRSLN